MAVVARLNEVGADIAAAGILPRIVNFLGDCREKEFLYKFEAVPAPRGWPEREHIRISIVGWGDGAVKCSWTVSPRDIINGTHVYMVARSMLRRLGHVLPYRNIRLTNAITKNRLRYPHHLWNPMWLLPKARLNDKASRLSHTLRHRMKTM